MDMVLHIIVGAVCGLVGCAPTAFLFEVALKRGTTQEASIARGLIAIAVSFTMLSVAVFVVYLVKREATLAFGCAVAVAFLAFWGIESVRACRDATASPRAEGKDR
ncbi:hypothetical protein [Parafannyhessea umbonata]|uniref:hypothetical protein n=1 Tax=Parafannyhessea umbonata TaxID=604330 RepID=UPI000999EA60|nr:hypothetical protein [Parafannyhessea umbonata]